MNRLRNYFIYKNLQRTDNVFEKAKIELTYNYSVFFLFLGLLYFVNLVINELWHHQIVIGFAVISLASIPFSLKYKQNVYYAANWFLLQEFIVSVGENILLDFHLDMASGLFPVAVALFSSFIYGKKRGFLLSLPFILIFVISSVNSIHRFIFVPASIVQPIPPLPTFFLVPFFLNIYTIWAIMDARHKAEKQIQEQKELLELKNRDIQEQKNLIEHKNKEIIDSITYARRIQRSLLPTDKYIDKTLLRMHDGKSSF